MGMVHFTKYMANYDWFIDFKWQVYSKYFDGAFCIQCVCFGIECGRNGGKLGKRFRSPLALWTTAVTFRSHCHGKCETRNLSVMAMDNFMDVMIKRAVGIYQLVNQLVQRQIVENRMKTKSIIKTVIFFWSNALPLRGKRDNNNDDPSLQGNFQALLAFWN